MKNYRFRVSENFPDVAAADVGQWLDQALASGASLAADPGGGPRWVSVECGEEKVRQLAQRENSKPAEVLRRLVAMRAPSSPVQSGDVCREEEKSDAAREAELLPPKSELPRRMQFAGEDVLPLVGLISAGERALLRWQLKIPRSVDLPGNAADSALADAIATVANGRAPAILSRNADLVKLTLVAVRHAWTVYEVAEKYARKCEAEQTARASGALSTVSPKVVSGTPVSAPRAAAGSGAAVESAGESPRSGSGDWGGYGSYAAMLEAGRAVYREKQSSLASEPVNPSLDVSL